jgi:hypothetical protein
MGGLQSRLLAPRRLPGSPNAVASESRADDLARRRVDGATSGQHHTRKRPQTPHLHHGGKLAICRGRSSCRNQAQASHFHGKEGVSGSSPELGLAWLVAISRRAEEPRAFMRLAAQPLLPSRIVAAPRRALQRLSQSSAGSKRNGLPSSVIARK